MASIIGALLNGLGVQASAMNDAIRPTTNRVRVKFLNAKWMTPAIGAAF
jgi:hypothetical protein